jgi:hypothetical protein
MSAKEKQGKIEESRNINGYDKTAGRKLDTIERITRWASMKYIGLRRLAKAYTSIRRRGDVKAVADVYWDDKICMLNTVQTIEKKLLPKEKKTVSICHVGILNVTRGPE